MIIYDLEENVIVALAGVSLSELPPITFWNPRAFQEDSLYFLGLLEFWRPVVASGVNSDSAKVLP